MDWALMLLWHYSIFWECAWARSHASGLIVAMCLFAIHLEMKWTHFWLFNSSSQWKLLEQTSSHTTQMHTHSLITINLCPLFPCTLHSFSLNKRVAICLRVCVCASLYLFKAPFCFAAMCSCVYLMYDLYLNCKQCSDDSTCLPFALCFSKKNHQSRRTYGGWDVGNESANKRYAVTKILVCACLFEEGLDAKLWTKTNKPTRMACHDLITNRRKLHKTLIHLSHLRYFGAHWKHIAQYGIHILFVSGVLMPLQFHKQKKEKYLLIWHLLWFISPFSLWMHLLGAHHMLFYNSVATPGFVIR